MRGLNRRFAVGIGAALIVAAVVPAVVVASIITGATSVGVNVSGKLAPNTVAQFQANIGAFNVVVECAASKTGFVLSSNGAGLGQFTIKKPSFTSCTDNFGGTDTVTTNTTNGPWTLTYVNSPNGTDPDKLQIGAPLKGVHISSSLVSHCSVALPTVAGPLSGTYDNLGNFSIPSQTVPFKASGTGCPGGAQTGGTFATVLAPGAAGTPGYVFGPKFFGVVPPPAP